MGTRRNGRSAIEQIVLEDGLTHVIRIPKGRRERVAFVFELIRRIRATAPLITSRDGEIVDAVLRDLNFTRAAQELHPGNPPAMRSRISQRYSYFQGLCNLFFSEEGDPSAFRTRSRRLHPRTRITGPRGIPDPGKGEIPLS